MALTWKVTPQDTLRIQDRAGGWIMWLCGGLLLLFGGKLLWWWLGAMGGFFQALFYMQITYLVTNIAGVVVLTVMTAAFVLPGLWLLFGRSVVEIDPALDSVLEMRDYVVWKKRTRHDFADIAAVRGTHELSRKSRSTGERSGTPVQSYRIDIVKKGIGTDEFLAAQPETKERAAELGQLLAAKLKVPFEDLTGKFDSYGDIIRERQGMDADGNYRDGGEAPRKKKKS